MVGRVEMCGKEKEKVRLGIRRKDLFGKVVVALSLGIRGFIAQSDLCYL